MGGGLDDGVDVAVLHVRVGKGCGWRGDYGVPDYGFGAARAVAFAARGVYRADPDE